MAASTISYDNIIIGAADPVPGRVVVLGCPYQLPQGAVNMLTRNDDIFCSANRQHSLS